MLTQQIINECNRQPCKWEIVKTGKGYLFAIYRTEKDKIINIAETDDYTNAFHAGKQIKTLSNPGRLSKFAEELKINGELRIAGKEGSYIELTPLKQWRKNAKQPMFDKFGNKNYSR